MKKLLNLGKHAKKWYDLGYKHGSRTMRDKTLREAKKEIGEIWKEYIDYVNKYIDSRYYAVYENGKMIIKTVNVITAIGKRL